MNLKKKGMNADIQINPTLFKQYEVTAVPTFCVDRIAGIRSEAISHLKYALDTIGTK